MANLLDIIKADAIKEADALSTLGRRRIKSRAGSGSFPYPLSRGGACACCWKHIAEGQQTWADRDHVFCSTTCRKKGSQ